MSTPPDASTHSVHPHPYQGAAYVLFAILIWAGWVIISRYSVTSHLSPYDITALRFGTASLVLAPILWRRGIKLGPYGWASSLFLALCMGAPYNTIAIAGMQFAPIAHAAIIITTMLLVTSLFSIWRLQESTSPVRILGIALSVVGIVLMLMAGKHVAGGKAWIGHACFIIGGVMWAGYALAARAWRVDALHATAAVSVWSGVLFIPIYLLFIPSHISADTFAESAFQALYQGLINSVFALLAFNRGIALLGASAASAFLPLVPVLATLGAIPLLGEVPGKLETMGLSVAVAGVFLSTGFASKIWARWRR